MTTFSQLIDDMAVELVRPDMITYLPSYLNQTIREIHTDAQTNMPVLFAQNRNELLVRVTSVGENGAFVWNIPKTSVFQYLESVFYDSIGRYCPEKSPAVALQPSYVDPYRHVYRYRVGADYVLSGCTVDTDVRLSWFNYLPSLNYYAPSLAPVKWDSENEQYVYRVGTTDPVAALLKSTNWLLEEHEEALKEGVRAKAWKRANEAERARMSFSSFETMRLGVQKSGVIADPTMHR